MTLDSAITLLPIIGVLTVLYSLAWHNQPARNPIKEVSKDPQAPPKQRGKRRRKKRSFRPLDSKFAACLSKPIGPSCFRHKSFLH